MSKDKRVKYKMNRRGVKWICRIMLLGWGMIGFVFSVFALNPAIIPQIDPASVTERIEKKKVPLTRNVSIVEERPTKEKREQIETEQQKEQKSRVRFKLNKVVINGSSIYSQEKLANTYKEYIGKEIGLSTIAEISKRIKALYYKGGYVLRPHGTVSVLVIISPKSVKEGKIYIEDGVVRLEILEGFISDIQIEGKISSGAKKTLEAYSKEIKKMRPFQYRELKRYMLLINDLPGLGVRSVLSAAKKTLGGTDAIFLVDQRQMGASVEYNNYGSRYLGPQQFQVVLNGRGLFGSADQLTLAGVKTPTRDDLESIQLYYQRPLNAQGLKLSMSSLYTETSPRGGGIHHFSPKGESRILNADLNYPLIRSSLRDLIVHGGFNWVDSLSKGKAIQYYNKIRALQLGFDYQAVDRFRGVNIATCDLSFGLPIFDASEKEDKNESSPSAGKSNFTKVEATISRLQRLTARFSVLLGLKGQYTNDVLLSSEQFSFGGRGWGRGFESSEMSGDRGLAGKLELRMNTFPRKALLNYVQYYLFYDAGMVWNIDAHGRPAVNRRGTTDVLKRMTGTSMGIGAKIQFSRHFSGQFELDKPLTNKVLSREIVGHDGKGWRGFFSVSAFI